MLDLVARLDASQHACTDPASRYRSRRDRRAAWDAWEASGGNLDDLPAGLLSATLDAAMKNPAKPAPKWGRR